MLNLDTLKYINFNERDVEVPFMLQFVTNNINKINSLLDIGGCYSYYTYANELRTILNEKLYDIVDLQSCLCSSNIVNNYYVNDVTKLKKQYDAITCISMLEHVNVNPLTKYNYTKKQLSVAKHCIKLAKKYFLFSFPFGADALFYNEYSNITLNQLNVLKQYCVSQNWSINTNFYFNEFPQGREKWIEITESRASTIAMVGEKGVQCICIFTGIKE